MASQSEERSALDNLPPPSVVGKLGQLPLVWLLALLIFAEAVIGLYFLVTLFIPWPSVISAWDNEPPPAIRERLAALILPSFFVALLMAGSLVAGRSAHQNGMYLGRFGRFVLSAVLILNVLGFAGSVESVFGARNTNDLIALGLFMAVTTGCAWVLILNVSTGLRQRRRQALSGHSESLERS